MGRRVVTLASVLSVLAIGAIPLHAGTISFIDSGSADFNKTTMFNETDPVTGLIATFSSSALNPFTTGTASDFVSSWGPEVLASLTPATLTITFSQTLSSITMDFGTINAEQLQLTPKMGGVVPSNTQPVNVVGTFDASSGSYEGTNLSFSGPNFNEVDLTTQEAGFAVGNIAVTISDSLLPEPSTAILLGAGTLLLAGRVRRSQRRSSNRA